MWIDVHNAVDCSAVDTYRQSLIDGTPITPPDPVTDCAAQFGNEDIYSGTYLDPTPKRQPISRGCNAGRVGGVKLFGSVVGMRASHAHPLDAIDSPDRAGDDLGPVRVRPRGRTPTGSSRTQESAAGSQPNRGNGWRDRMT
jgi:hypothetical protein